MLARVSEPHIYLQLYALTLNVRSLEPLFAFPSALKSIMISSSPLVRAPPSELEQAPQSRLRDKPLVVR